MVPNNAMLTRHPLFFLECVPVPWRKKMARVSVGRCKVVVRVRVSLRIERGECLLARGERQGRCDLALGKFQGGRQSVVEGNSQGEWFVGARKRAGE